MGCPILLLTSTVSTLGGLVFGYELGIISGALLQIKAEFGLSCVQQEAVVSALLVGALLASLVGGCLMDHHGRRNSMLFSNLLIVAGSLLLVARSYPGLVVGRITVGFGMCISSMSCCIFVSEMVSPDRRGLLVTLYEAGITVGILAAYATNYLLSDTSGGWKVMFGLAVAPTLAQFLCICLLPSNTDRFGSHSTERNLTDSVQNHVSEETRLGGKGITYLFKRKDNMRTRTIIGLGLVIFQQFTGQPNVLLYASTIFHSLGFHSNASAVLETVGLGMVKVLATLISVVLADRAGRRPLLIGGCIIMAVGLLTIGLLSGRSVLSTGETCDVSNHGPNATSELNLPGRGQTSSNVSLDKSGGLFDSRDVKGMVANDPGIQAARAGVSTSPPPTGQGLQGRVINWIILTCMMAVVGAYSVGFGPITWLVLSEIFPAGVRGRAFAFTSCFNWAANLLVTCTFLNVIDAIGLSGMFLLYGTTCVAAGLFFYWMLPETMGKTLEDIDKELSMSRGHSGEECCSTLRRKTTSVKYQRVHCQQSDPN